MTKDEQIAVTVQTLADIHRVQLTPAAARAYLVTLGELSIAEVREAERRAMREFEHMPAPAQLLRLGLKSRRDGQETQVQCTNRMLEAMKPSSYPTAEQLAEMRNDWRDVVQDLGTKKEVNAAVSAPPSIHPSEDAARRAILELEARQRAADEGHTEGTS